MKPICWQGMLLVIAACCARAWAIAPGTLDDFQDGTLQDWGGGADANIATGGPAGSGDHFLQTGAGTFGFHSHIAIHNDAARWVGDYTAAGVVKIEADIKVLAGSPLEMRVVLFGGPGFSRATSTTSVPVPADGQWHHLVFGVTAADLTLVSGTDSLSAIIQNVQRLMLRHQTGVPASGGTPVSAQVGFDNIKAVAPPRPR